MLIVGQKLAFLKILLFISKAIYWKRQFCRLISFSEFSWMPRSFQYCCIGWYTFAQQQGFTRIWPKFYWNEWTIWQISSQDFYSSSISTRKGFRLFAKNVQKTVYWPEFHHSQNTFLSSYHRKRILRKYRVCHDKVKIWNLITWLLILDIRVVT